MLARLSRWTLPTLIIVAGLVMYRLLLANPAAESLELPRNEPWLIAPLHDAPRMVTDRQLYDVLDKLRPRLEPVNSNDWVHALRLWTRHAEFDDPGVPSGREMLNFFLRDDVYQRYAGKGTPPLLTIEEEGVRLRSYDDSYPFRTTSSYHQDDHLATLAETGVPLDTALLTRQGEAQVGDLLRASLLSYHPQRHESDWTIISYARYAFPLLSWRNRYGEQIDCQQMVDELIDRPLDVGPCNGLHRLEALVLLYRVDQEAGGVLPRGTRNRIVEHMQRVSGLLVESQHRDGFWTRSWPRGAEAAEDTGADVGERVLVTGHHLEWLALAPAEVLPPRENLVRAGQWLTRALLEMDPRELHRRYGPYSHAGRALSYWRGKEAWQAWQEGRRAFADGGSSDSAG